MILRTCPQIYCAGIMLRRSVLGIPVYSIYIPVPAPRRAGQVCHRCEMEATPERRIARRLTARLGPPQQTDHASRAPQAAFRRALQAFRPLATIFGQVLRKARGIQNTLLQSPVLYSMDDVRPRAVR